MKSQHPPPPSKKVKVLYKHCYQASFYSAIKYFLTRARELWNNTSASTVNSKDDDEMDKSRAENKNAKLVEISVQPKGQQEYFVNHILNSDSNCS